jgi:hypothetical protein
MASRRAATGFCRSNLQFKLRKLHPSIQNCDAKKASAEKQDSGAETTRLLVDEHEEV